MALAALVTWLVTAVGGFLMLGTWIARGGPRQPREQRRLAPGLIFGHFALAALGLVAWIIYLATDTDGFAWTGLILLVPVALLGFTMLARWLPLRRGAAATTHGAAPAESHFPVGVVVGHGLFAVATVVLALLAVVGS